MRIGKLVVVGVGLIGASCALALRARGQVGEVVGVGRTRANLDEARSRGAIDRACTLDDDWVGEAGDADVVLLATPVGQYATLLAHLATRLRGDAVVTDAGSTKGDVVAIARASLGAHLPRFVPGHPIAGSDRSGAAAADARLFAGRTVVLTPLTETAPDATARVRALWDACGANVRISDAETHDRLYAAVSHLPHVVAYAFVAELAGRPEAEALLAAAGTGFRDFTRIAGSSPEMWRDIALGNRVALRAELARLAVALAGVDAALATGDGAALEALFSKAATARRRFDAQPGHTDDGA